METRKSGEGRENDVGICWRRGSARIESADLCIRINSIVK